MEYGTFYAHIRLGYGGVEDAPLCAISIFWAKTGKNRIACYYDIVIIATQTEFIPQLKQRVFFRFIYKDPNEPEESGEGMQENTDGMFRFEKRMNWKSLS